MADGTQDFKEQEQGGLYELLRFLMSNKQLTNKKNKDIKWIAKI